MPVHLSVDAANRISDRVWRASVDPSDLRVIGGARLSAGGVSVVLLPALAPPEARTSNLTFEPRYAELLNLGSTRETVFVFGATLADVEHEDPVHEYGPSVQHDDDAFLKEAKQLPDELNRAAGHLLGTIRSEFGGYFQRSASGRYINRPDNFWTAKVQPRDQSIAITVRGFSDEFSGTRRVEVKDDRTGYSRFKLQRVDDLPVVVDIIRRSGRR